ncbi:hypothetical protein TVAG_107750 [Trichomonas vaginalis G3]|uniref:Thioredoxin domain-containing protein n=1 Tax=Trichomonas vaginalis (strain ATCC PRA-98 / G3) TaxID=412133 RepID=A2F0S1_TRIV3|nr:cell redox homeostasis [Trichomonas vaginalis G3]EAY01516.1 hypothetical protein TVAG_107750 [Trichomonas vaginalis G3]KAI5482180.1 cell redox homeostasis [Trichomonas vaginalis G3]|eukprot:XP_001330288.1 hypothetical protein [Trichomonas vaginalis G3]
MISFLFSLSFSFIYQEIENEAQAKTFIGGKNHVLTLYYKNGCTGFEDALRLLNKTAEMFENLSVITINCMNYDNMQFCVSNQIDRYPTIHLYAAKQRRPRKFTEYRDLDFILDFVEYHLKKPAINRPKRIMKLYQPKDINAMIENKTNFVAIYYKPFCRYCAQAMPHFKNLFNIFKKDNANIGLLSCETYEDYCEKMNVTYYPKVNFYSPEFPNGTEFMEQYTLQPMLKFVNENLNTHRNIFGLLDNTFGQNEQADNVIDEYFQGKHENVIERLQNVNASQVYLDFVSKLIENGPKFIADELKSLTELNNKAESLGFDKATEELKIDLDLMKEKLNVLKSVDAKRAKNMISSDL